MVKRHPGSDSPGEAGVYHPVVVRQAAGVPIPVAQRVHPGPAGGEAVVPDAQLDQDVQVLFEAVVGVAGDGPVARVRNGSRTAAESVPNTLPAAVQPGVSLRLIGAGSGAPNKILSKSQGVTP